MYKDEIMEEGTQKQICCSCACRHEHDRMDTALEIACHGATLLLGFALGLAAMKFWLWRWLM